MTDVFKPAELLAPPTISVCLHDTKHTKCSGRTEGGTGRKCRAGPETRARKEQLGLGGNGRLAAA